jgi:hypothetical protein
VTLSVRPAAAVSNPVNAPVPSLPSSVTEAADSVIRLQTTTQRKPSAFRVPPRLADNREQLHLLPEVLGQLLVHQPQRAPARISSLRHAKVMLTALLAAVASRAVNVPAPSLPRSVMGAVALVTQRPTTPQPKSSRANKRWDARQIYLTPHGHQPIEWVSCPCISVGVLGCCLE